MKHQRGLTVLGALTLVALSGFILLSCFRLLPIYIQHYQVHHVLQGMANDTKIDYESSSKIRDMIVRRFEINSITQLNVDSIKIQPREDYYHVNISYAVKTKFAFNISFLVEFNEAVELRRD